MHSNCISGCTCIIYIYMHAERICIFKSISLFEFTGEYHFIKYVPCVISKSTRIHKGTTACQFFNYKSFSVENA